MPDRVQHPRRPIRKRWFRRGIQGGIVIVTSMLILEIALRFMGITDPVLYESDEAAGYRLRPGQRVEYLGNVIEVNEWGLRDPRAIDATPPAAVKRMLVLGDSVTWGGIGLSYEELFTTQLEDDLRPRGQDFQVLNAGVNGYSVAQMAALYEAHLAPLQPDLVLVYAIPRDFTRPPVAELTGASVAFPVERPAFALGTALQLARVQVHGRLGWDWLGPDSPTRPAAGEYDEEAALEANIAAYKRLVEVTGGKAILLLAPTRDGAGDERIEGALRAAGVAYERVVDYLTPGGWEKRFVDRVHLSRLGHDAMSTAITEALVTMSMPPEAEVVCEETVYSYTPPNNGSGPFWSFGCTTIARLGENVVVAEMETGEDAPLLCNTRWRIHKRTPAGWEVFAKADGYRQREPAVLATTAPDTFFVNVNDSTEPPGTKYGPCKPHLIRFGVGDPNNRRELMPEWQGDPHFTDHSYRGFAADRQRNELLMLNIDAKTSVQNWCRMTADGEVLGNGQIEFPIRSCYPQVALTGARAYVLAIGDIREPVKEWAEYKFEQTQRKWDYVFRILHFTWTPDIGSEAFAEPIVIADVDDTAGHIMNQDLWIAPNGDAHILYTQRQVASALMRDKFFPDLSILDSLHLAVAREGEIIARETLLEGTETTQPGTARFHETPDGTVYILMYATIDGDAGNYLMPLNTPIGQGTPVKLEMKRPMGTFLLANTRAGNAPSHTIDAVGAGPDNTVSYVQVRLD